MYKEKFCRSALSHAHSQWNGQAFLPSQADLTEHLKTYFRPGQIVLIDHELMVTDVGYVVMAIHSNRAVMFNSVLVVPGVDSEGRRGHLVLSRAHVPFHSYALNATAAAAEARESQRKAQLLVSAFGSKSAMYAAVKAAPWHTLVTQQDLKSSGLCQWGVDTFMRRYGLRAIAYRFGLPKIVLRATGVYGDRIIAARLVRGGFCSVRSPHNRTEPHPQPVS